MAKAKNNTGNHVSTNKTSEKDCWGTSNTNSSTSSENTKKIPSLTSIAPDEDDRERRDGPGGN